MTQRDASTIEAHGFSILDPAMTGLDDDLPIIDWDALAAERIGIFSDRQRRCAVA